MKTNQIGGYNYIPQNQQVHSNQRTIAQNKIQDKCKEYVNIPFVPNSEFETFYNQFIDIRDYMLQIGVDQEVILVLGNTGSGKSTLINYLNDHQGIAKKQQYTNNFIIDYAKPITKIGHDMVSETYKPNRCEIQKQIFWDCPGFEDTRGPTTEMINSYAIDQIGNHVKYAKVLAVIEENAFIDQKGNFFRDMIFKMSKILPTTKNFVDNVVFCFTKTGEIIDYKKALLQISKEQNNLTKDQRIFIQDIAHNERFALFPKPIKEGAISSEDQKKIFFKLSKCTYTNSKLEPFLSVKGIKKL